MKIWKFAVAMAEMGDVIDVRMPGIATVLSVGNQRESLVIYAAVDDNAPTMRYRQFRIAGTGHPIDEKIVGMFVGTVMFGNGSLVLHVFDLGWRWAQ